MTMYLKFASNAAENLKFLIINVILFVVQFNVNPIT